MPKGVIQIGILGFGTVGCGAYLTLLDNLSEIQTKVGSELKVKKIADIDLERPRPVKVDFELLTRDAYEVIEDEEIDIIVEAIGGIEPAKDYVLKALRNRKNVVTSNKELIAKYGQELFQAAEENKVDLCFEGSVGGGIPIIRPLKECLAGNRIEEIIGIVNGTTNYILTKMTYEGQEFAEILKEAQERGYAEADPSYDIEGIDAAYKIAILASVAFGSRVNPEEIHREGISKITPKDIEYAQELGYVVKLLAIAKARNDEMELRVHPAFLPQAHPLAAVVDVFNGIFVKGSSVGDLMFYGRGAGALPTGSAVVGDIIDIARNINHNATGRIGCTCFKDKRLRRMEEIVTKYYIRMQVVDKPGVLAKIASAFGEEEVSIASVVQKSRGEIAEIVLVTHEAKERNLQNTLKKLAKLPVVSEISNMVRVEES